MDFKEEENVIMKFWDIVCVSDFLALKKIILEKDHISSFNIHPGATKMYQDLKRMFWWPYMKKVVAEFVYSCLICQKSKIKHQNSYGLMQPLSIPEWKCDSISMDFIVGLPKTAKESESI